MCVQFQTIGRNEGFFIKASSDFRNNLTYQQQSKLDIILYFVPLNITKIGKIGVYKTMLFMALFILLGISHIIFIILIQLLWIFIRIRIIGKYFSLQLQFTLFTYYCSIETYNCLKIYEKYIYCKGRILPFGF